jgi:sarcosine oxidase
VAGGADLGGPVMGDFIIDTVPGHDNIAVGLGAGHGFNFASVIGRLLAGLSGFETEDFDLTPFAIDWAILLEWDPVRTLLI